MQVLCLLLSALIVKTHTAHAFLLNICQNNNHNGIFDVLLTKTMLVKMENSGPLLSQIRFKSGPGQIWDHNTGTHETNA